MRRKEEITRRMKKRRQRRRNWTQRWYTRHKYHTVQKHRWERERNFFFPHWGSPLTIQGLLPGIVSSCSLWSMTNNSRSTGFWNHDVFRSMVLQWNLRISSRSAKILPIVLWAGLKCKAQKCVRWFFFPHWNIFFTADFNQNLKVPKETGLKTDS